MLASGLSGAKPTKYPMVEVHWLSKYYEDCRAYFVRALDLPSKGVGSNPTSLHKQYCVQLLKSFR